MAQLPRDSEPDKLMILRLGSYTGFGLICHGNYLTRSEYSITNVSFVPLKLGSTHSDECLSQIEVASHATGKESW